MFLLKPGMQFYKAAKFRDGTTGMNIKQSIWLYDSCMDLLATV
jgi:hypothetical protein